MADDQLRVRREIDLARRLAGLSDAELGRSTGLSGSSVMRFVTGSTKAMDLDRIARLAASVGLPVRLRTFPSGDPIRDAGQERLLDRLRREIATGLRWRMEVPLPIAGDLRASDAVVSGAGWSVPVEAETVIQDVQARELRLSLKQGDGQADHLVLLIADTPRNRRALASAPAAFGAYPLRTRDVLIALRGRGDPGASGIVFL